MLLMQVKKRMRNDFVEHLYKQSDLFDDCPPEFDKKIVTYKINDKFYIIFDPGIILFSDMNYERI
jgi:hypothetical protein